MEGRWDVHPDAGPIRTPAAPVRPGRVVGLGAICDLGSGRVDEPRDRSFSVAEFVTLDDGRHVMLHEDHGFTIGWRSSGQPHLGDMRERHTVESITSDVLTVMLPDE